MIVLISMWMTLATYVDDCTVISVDICIPSYVDDFLLALWMTVLLPLCLTVLLSMWMPLATSVDDCITIYVHDCIYISPDECIDSYVDE